jgi:UDP-GlcNAc:undecaprenyl-phosphate/decaprenyl-phosphate GlcNAc-1-phosphate transferase
MSAEWLLVFTVLVSLIVSLVATWVARTAAVRFALLDRPDQRKVHANPIPLLGGLAIYAAFLLAVLATNSRVVLAEGTAVLIGATLLVLVGAYDDQYGMSPRVKLAAQFLAAIIVVAGGVQVSLFTNPWLNLPLTIFWMVGIGNAMNLLDNMDGLSAGIALIAASFFTLLALSQGQVWVATTSAALAGATLGFLMYNWNPATIFMGDAGSLLLGYMLAILGMKLRFTNIEPQRTWLIPILILAVPIFDTTLVTISRLRRGISITSGGKDHTSHRLVRLGLNVREAVTAIYLAGLIVGAAAIGALLVPQLNYVYGIAATLAVAGLAALLLLERVDLSQTGQKTRAERRAELRVLQAAAGEPLSRVGRQQR